MASTSPAAMNEADEEPLVEDRIWHNYRKNRRGGSIYDEEEQACPSQKKEVKWLDDDLACHWR